MEKLEPILGNAINDAINFLNSKTIELDTREHKGTLSFNLIGQIVFKKEGEIGKVSYTSRVFGHLDDSTNYLISHAFESDNTDQEVYAMLEQSLKDTGYKVDFGRLMTRQISIKGDITLEQLAVEKAAFRELMGPYREDFYHNSDL